jgi:hypothetical protein
MRERQKERRRAVDLRRAAEAAEPADSGRDLDLRANPQLAEEKARQNREEEKRRTTCQEYIRKKDQYERDISRDVNIPQTNAE